MNGNFRWYVCHNCGWEVSLSEGARNACGCENVGCWESDMHVHSNADGELPKSLPVPAQARGPSE